MPVEDGLLERFNALTRQLDRVERGLWALAEAKASTEALMERVQALGAGAAEGEAVARRTDQDEKRGRADGPGSLTALVVAASRALVMFVPKLPVTRTIAVKILEIQRSKLDGLGVITRSFGWAEVASINEWMTAAEEVVPPHPGEGLLGLPRVLGQAGAEGRREVAQKGPQGLFWAILSYSRRGPAPEGPKCHLCPGAKLNPMSWRRTLGRWRLAPSRPASATSSGRSRLRR